MKKALYVLLTCATLTLSLPSLSVTSLAAEPTEATVETSVETSSDTTTYAAVTEWRYKVINGYVYKRLYDKTNKIWLIDWIPC